MGDMHNSNLVLVVAGATSSVAREAMLELCTTMQVVALVRNPVSAGHFGSNAIRTATANYADNTLADLNATLSDLQKGAPDRLKLVFVNFAVQSKNGLLPNLTAADFMESYGVNVLTSLPPIKTMLPRMINARWGRIILLSSTRGIRGDSGISAYAASKSALVGLSGSLAREYGKLGITSNLLSLGYFESDLLSQVPDVKLQQLLHSIPGRKYGTGRDVAAAIRMLIETDYINGSTLRLDGGAL